MISKKAKAVITALKAAMPIMDRLDLEKHRRAQDSIGLILKPVRGTVFQEFEIDGIRAAWVFPPLYDKERKKDDTFEKSKERVILHCHGGAFTCGSLKYSKVFAARLAHKTGMKVLTYEYRLAPEHPFPAALDDSIAVYSFLLEEGYLPGRIAITGESAGGNLCLSIVCACREKGLPQPGLLVLLSPWLDLTGSGETYHGLADKDPSLNPDSLMQSARYYAGEKDLSNPLISPVFADFSGFPPTLIQVGTNEILLSDSTRLYDYMKKQGVDVELQVYEGMFHVFQMVDLPESKKAMENIKNFINSRLVKE